MDPQTLIILIIISLLFSALFSGIEIAFISSNRLHISLRSNKGILTAKVVEGFIKKPAKFITTTLVGNTIALVVYGIFMASLIEPIIASHLPSPLDTPGPVLVTQTIISSLVVLITAEFVPKSIFLRSPDLMVEVFSIPMQIIYWILYPVVFVVFLASRFIITRVFRLEYSETKPVFGLTDLNNYIQNNIQSNESKEEVKVTTKILNNALEFKKARVRDCMIPRTEIIAVNIEDGVAGLKKAFIDSGHSKIPVYNKSIDDIIGYCHSTMLFKKPDSIEDILTPISVVPETMLAQDLLVQFISDKRSIVLVVDEFGGTAGMVSIEDVIEEIFGEIQDEHDEEDLVENPIDDYNYILSARHEIEYLNEKYNLHLPEGDYDTLGGLIISENEDIPRVNDVIEIPPFKITILGMEDARIDKVKLTIAHEIGERN